MRHALVRRKAEEEEHMHWISKMSSWFVPAALALTLVAIPFAEPARAEDPAADAIVKPINTMIKAIQYAKYPLAGKSLDYDGMAKLMLGEAWDEMDEAQRKEFVEGVRFLMENVSFRKANEKFEHLDAILYDDPKVEGDTARVGSTIVIFHDLKKEEIEVEYLMAKGEKGWRIQDVILEEESTTEAIREDQIEDLLDEGGIPHLLKTLRDKVAEVKEDLEDDG
jgi:phospholipid transport system substrate-binding protein